MQNEIEELKLKVEEFNEDDKNNQLNNIILVDEDDDDVGWDLDEEEDHNLEVETGTKIQQSIQKKEIINDEKRDVEDDDWDAPTSGFISV